ncbi:MAG: phosphatidylserine decarboxylase family protein [Euryarchaeota archaeon]|nr:phosphatidylserine decarboxylase family protein [Euryarchaeota archaeon]
MFARGSSRYLSVATVLAGVFLVLAAVRGGAWWVPTVAFAFVYGFILWFFRDPERAIGEGVVAPADGKVLSTESGTDRAHLVIFMAPTSVHVNRSPLDGRILKTEYRQGSHVPAFKKESERNERFDLELSTGAGTVTVALIAGTVARRIHPYVTPGNAVKKGDRIGLIAFGSRCELTLPGGHTWTVSPGQWIKAGETTVAVKG